MHIVHDISPGMFDHIFSACWDRLWSSARSKYTGIDANFINVITLYNRVTGVS